jgi:hypothetical protein
MLGIFMALCKYWAFQILKFNKFIFVDNNWLSNTWVKCPKFYELASTCETKLDLMEELNAKFEHKVKCDKFS